MGRSPLVVFARYVRGLLTLPSLILHILNCFSIIYCDHSQDGIQRHDPHSDEYLQGFYDTAKKIYEKFVGRPWPDVISISEAVYGDHDLNDDENELF